MVSVQRVHGPDVDVPLKKNVDFQNQKTFLAAKAQLNTCNCVASVCLSVVKTEFLPVYMCLHAFACIYMRSHPCLFIK